MNLILKSLNDLSEINRFIGEVKEKGDFKDNIESIKNVVNKIGSKIDTYVLENKKLSDSILGSAHAASPAVEALLRFKELKDTKLVDIINTAKGILPGFEILSKVNKAFGITETINKIKEEKNKLDIQKREVPGFRSSSSGMGSLDRKSMNTFGQTMLDKVVEILDKTKLVGTITGFSGDNEINAVLSGGLNSTRSVLSDFFKPTTIVDEEDEVVEPIKKEGKDKKGLSTDLKSMGYAALGVGGLFLINLIVVTIERLINGIKNWIEDKVVEIKLNLSNIKILGQSPFKEFGPSEDEMKIVRERKEKKYDEMGKEINKYRNKQGDVIPGSKGEKLYDSYFKLGKEIGKYKTGGFITKSGLQFLDEEEVVLPKELIGSGLNIRSGVTNSEKISDLSQMLGVSQSRLDSQANTQKSVDNLTGIVMDMYKYIKDNLGNSFMPQLPDSKFVEGYARGT